MANAFIQVPPQSTGLKVQTFENVVGANTVEAEAVTLVRSSDNTEVGTAAQPLADNLSQVAGTNLGATAVVNYGSTPAAVAVPGVNAFITNTPAVTVSGTSIVAGNLTNNNAAPAASNVGVLSALANAANPSWTEGDQVLVSVDLSGHQRVVATGAAATGSAAVGNPVLSGGKSFSTGNVAPLGCDAGGTVSILRLETGSDAIPNTAYGQAYSSIDGAYASLGVFPSIFNGTTWDRARSAGIGNAVAATGIAAHASYGEYLTTAPAPTTGQYSALQTDYAGSLFIKPIRRSNTAAKATTISNTTATTIVTAPAAGIFADLSLLQITVTPQATTGEAFTVTVSDGTNSYIYDMFTGVTATLAPTTISQNFNPPLAATTAATAWTATVSTITTQPTIHVTTNVILQKAS